VSTAEQPSVTVIMPIRNEGRFIERSLDAVLAQDYPAELVQVLVADGRSTDNTRDVVRDKALAHPERRIELVDNPGGIVPTGFNAALASADGKEVAFGSHSGLDVGKAVVGLIVTGESASFIPDGLVLAFEVWLAPVMLPAPDATAKVTVTPCTGLPS